jgi:hypothetical protein
MLNEQQTINFIKALLTVVGGIVIIASIITITTIFNYL